MTRRQNYERSSIVDRPSFEAPKEEPKLSSGTVTNCERLNVRKHPAVDAEVVNIIDKGDEVTVDTSQSTAKFYKIRMTKKRERPLADEVIDGFCMKEFIKVE